MRDPNVRLVILLVALAGAGWYYWQAKPGFEESPALELPQPSQPEAPRTETRRAPLNPVPKSTPTKVERDPLPLLAESDGAFRHEVVELFGDFVGRLLVNEALIEKLVATVDNLPSAEISEKIRPVGRLTTAPIVESAGNGTFRFGESNFARYNYPVALLTTVEIDRIVEAYRHFYPLMQESYGRLGYPDGYFNDRLIQVIDHLLQTPEPARPIVLVRPNMLYEFADPDLESLSSGQKLLIRIGPENAVRVRQVLSSFRKKIASEESTR